LLNSCTHLIFRLTSLFFIIYRCSIIVIFKSKKTFMGKNDTARFMKKAIRLSITNVEKGNGGPFGAVIVKDGKVIARGVNRVTSTNDPTAHAEVVAIRKAC